MSGPDFSDEEWTGTLTMEEYRGRHSGSAATSKSDAALVQRLQAEMAVLDRDEGDTVEWARHRMPAEKCRNLPAQCPVPEPAGTVPALRRHCAWPPDLGTLPAACRTVPAPLGPPYIKR